jgi:hypothetical protein
MFIISSYGNDFHLISLFYTAQSHCDQCKHLGLEWVDKSGKSQCCIRICRNKGGDFDC